MKAHEDGSGSDLSFFRRFCRHRQSIFKKACRHRPASGSGIAGSNHDDELEDKEILEYSQNEGDPNTLLESVCEVLRGRGPFVGDYLEPILFPANPYNVDKYIIKAR
jgi:hypothetical protein